MQRLTFTEYAITILLLLILVFSAAQLLQSWLLSVSEKTSARIERAQR